MPQNILIGSEIEFSQWHIDCPSEAPELCAAHALLSMHHKLHGPPVPNAPCPALEFDTEGYRAYTDHSHHELSLPLVSSASAFARQQLQANDTMVRVKKAVERAIGPISLSYNNTSRHGRAWGWHCSFLVPRPIYDGWVEAEWAPLLRLWVPFLVSSLPLLGTGKLGSELADSPAALQLSQRADFMDQIIGQETVTSKSLINTRDEALADQSKFARLHCIFFDGNRMPCANFLKAGLCQLVLSLLVDGRDCPDLSLRVPLRALAAISRDLTFTQPVELADGRKRTALELQRMLADCCADAIAHGRMANAVPDASVILTHWEKTLDQVAQRDPVLPRRLDWACRLECIRRARTAGSPRRDAALADAAYGEVGGVFDDLMAAGGVDLPEQFLPREAFRSSMPVARERARGRLIHLFGRQVVTADWDEVTVRDDDDHCWTIPLPDPLDGESLCALVHATPTPTACLAHLLSAGLAQLTEPACVLLESQPINPKETQS